MFKIRFDNRVHVPSRVRASVTGFSLFLLGPFLGPFGEVSNEGLTFYNLYFPFVSIIHGLLSSIPLIRFKRSN
jgi:hypothetical protein